MLEGWAASQGPGRSAESRSGTSKSPGSFRIVRASTGNSDLSGRDSCADLVEFTS